MRSLVTAVLSFLMLTSCKPPDTPKAESSVLADEGGKPMVCACNDLACWDKATSDGVSGQLSCVQDALGAAANLASAGSLASAKVLTGVAQLYQLGLTTYQVAGEANGLNIVNLVKSILDGNSAVLEHVFGADYVTSPGLACFKNGNDAIKGLVDASGNLMSVPQGQDSLDSIISVFKTLGSAADALVNGISALDACAQLLQKGGPSAEIANTLNSVGKAWGNIMAGFNTVMAFSNCGWQISKGAITLGANTQCLWEDLNGLAASRASLQQQRLATLNRPAPNQGTSAAQSCNDEPNNCNKFAQMKFGLWLGQQTYFSYATRSYLCADMCGNKGVGSGECQRNAEAIFPGDVPACKPICNVSQCQTAIEVCVSHCCGQEGSCVDAAHQKMRDYNR